MSTAGEGSRFATSIEALDLRGACPMDRPECPDRCACVVNLWAALRPQLAAGVTLALDGWPGDEPRSVGSLDDPDSPISRWARGEPMFGGGDG